MVIKTESKYEKSRRLALERYYNNPVICKQCKNVIKVKDREKTSHVRQRKFCSLSCAAKFNNNAKGSRRKNAGLRFCQECGRKIRYRIKNGSYTCRKYCFKCTPYRKRIAQERLRGISDKTKSEVFKRAKNWQTARNLIRKYAFRIFKRSRKKYECQKCGYSLHVAICHKKPVSKFPGNAKIKEINDIKNLMALCENHHWEYDHGFLILKKGKLINK